ncbi:hypothetical protein T310_1554, partial [Rasamsonia emersonii CBS 393.64]
MRPQSRNEFEIAIICALPLEFDAVEALFDEHYDEFDHTYGKQRGDGNWYRTGRIGRHSIVLACLPGMGKGSAASAASSLRVSFIGINLALVVGICGGVPFPSENIEIILGDVIISDSVIEYDFGRQYPDGFQRKSGIKETLGRPNRDIRTFLSGLKTRRMHNQLQEELLKCLQDLQKHLDGKWRYPGATQDRLFEASYRHKHYHQVPVAACICADCQSSRDPVCDEALENDCSKLRCMGGLIQRSRLSADSPNPLVHFGSIASADTVMKSGEHRDALAKTEKVIGFEMEGAGVWDNLPCVIIKGVCDYADSHKNKIWQDYAAATAASCAKAFLEFWPATTQDLKNPVYWLVPFQRNEHFVGRESQLAQLEEGLFVDGRFSKMALFALGGMGKTSIALELAYRVRDKYPTCSIFWVTSTSPESFERSYQKIGQRLALPGMEDKNTDVKKLVMDHLNDQNAGQWFMIFDNADNIDAWFKKSETGCSHRLADYVPSSSRGCALLTTRNQQIARKFAHHSVIEVVKMDIDTSMHLLRKTLGQEEILGDNKSTEQLLEQLCFIPLAIVQAGAYMNMNYITIVDYLSLLNDTEESLVETLSEDFEDDWRYQDQKNPVVTTWIVSFEQILTQNPLAADYLSLISCTEPKAIPQAFLPPAPSTKQRLEAIACLISYSFLSRREDNSFDMHRLVHIATRNWLKKTQNFKRYYKKVISRFAEIFPTPEYENRDIWRTYFPHVKFTLSLNRVQIAIDHRLLTRYGGCLLRDGRYFEAELPLTEAAEATKQMLGVEHPETLTSMGNLASTYRNQGRWNEAEE